MRLVRTVVVCTLLLSACSGDDDTAEPETTVSTSTTAPAVSAFPDVCAQPDLEARLSGDGARTPFAIEGVAAVRRLSGVAYTVYLGDFPFPPGHNWRFAIPEVPPGATLFATGLDYFDVSDVEALSPAEEGDSAETFDSGSTIDEPSTFLSVTSDDAASSSVNRSGTIEILGLTSDDICVEVDIRSETGIELVGVVTAPILADV